MPKPKLKLYCVTIAWDREDYEQGDYSAKTWAVDDDAAFKNVATEMADTQSLTGKERKQAIDLWIAEARSYAAEVVSVRVKDDIYDLLAGPKKGTLTTRQEQARMTILNLLDLFGG